MEHHEDFRNFSRLKGHLCPSIKCNILMNKQGYDVIRKVDVMNFARNVDYYYSYRVLCPVRNRYKLIWLLVYNKLTQRLWKE